MEHNDKKRRSRCAPLLAACVAVAAMAILASCHKTCACYGYDGLLHEYSADELPDGNCGNMIIQSGVRYYSYCTWDD